MLQEDMFKKKKWNYTQTKSTQELFYINYFLCLCYGSFQTCAFCSVVVEGWTPADKTNSSAHVYPQRFYKAEREAFD